MNLKQLEAVRRQWLDRHLPYKMMFWRDFDFSALHNIIYRKRAGRGDHSTYNDVIIMGDTETSKRPEIYRKVQQKKHGITVNEYDLHENMVVAWTISLRAMGRNLVTIWGRKPSEMVEAIELIHNSMQGEKTILYFHNMAYDWTFLRKFMMRAWGEPDEQLNTKPHYPIMISWEEGLILKDSLILSQRSIEKWAADLGVEHQKAVGKWDYDKIRTQEEDFSADELEYIEHDTLAGVECLDALRIALHKHVYSMPYTATGIPREEVQKRGKEAHARDFFVRTVMDYYEYKIAEMVYHGGYTHANRHEVGFINQAQCFDFASSYPFVLLSEKYPMEKWTDIGEAKIDFILDSSEDYAFMFKFIAYDIQLKDPHFPMPVLQFSKAVKTINATIDNGRILRADYVEIYLNELDLSVIAEQYTMKGHICTEVKAALKQYLPRYLTDYIFQCYQDKTQLKGGDPVLYSLAKAKLNSIYGMMVQKCVKEDIREDYGTGDYIISEEQDPKEIYNEYLKTRTKILLYQWGCWCTSYAMRNLFELGKCISGVWLYSDTDSCYATEWNYDAVDAYNEKCKDKIRANGYGLVIHKGREWWLGCAETDGDKDIYTEYTALGAKRYCGRCKADGDLHITVSGVPKKGAAALNDDIRNFRRGLVFPGTMTGKLTHTYIYKDAIEILPDGTELGDSIDLTPCNYLLDQIEIYDFDDLQEEEIFLQVYEEDLKL